MRRSCATLSCTTRASTRGRTSRRKLAHRPTKEDLHGFTAPTDDAGLIDHEVIPLSLALADAVITQLRAAATEVREAIDQAQRA